MKLKFLLYLLFLSAILSAQEPYRSLIITEARLDDKNDRKHFEITNMGDSEINLNEFKFGGMRPYIQIPVLDVHNDPWVPEKGHSFMLPSKILKPGESFVIAPYYDYAPKMYKLRVDEFEGFERRKQIEFLDLADLLIHFPEASEINLSTYPNVKDSVSSIDNFTFTMFESNEGTGGFYLEHHFAPGDSAVVDQVNCNFDNAGKNFAHSYDVAGVTGATGNSLLLRKYSIKTGNLDFFNARGVGEEDSEWIAIPFIPGASPAWRDLWWTVGNHGAYELNESTLESDVIEVDYANKTLTVPWGVLRLDDIMRYVKKKPGIAWHYILNPIREDSIFYSARNGDKLTIFVAGNTLQTATFNIVVEEPASDANIVVPKARINIGSAVIGGPIRTNTQAGIEGIDWPRVTKHDHGADTIFGTWFGLPNAMRTDTLIKYLEKPANANWEFVWIDGVKRPDLKNGDILKVTAQSGAIKEYFIQVQPYKPNSNANLASITYPDIPNFYKGIFGWIGDTIPNFTPTSYNYRIEVPLSVDGIPALIAKTQDMNATVDVKRAISLTGLAEDRTVSFIVTAEDGSTTNTYNVELVKEKDLTNVQPYHADPFLSELIFWESYNNSFGEICNPGNQPLDLSNYMIAMSFNSNPASVIESRMGVNDWLDRYDKYVPGYKWVNRNVWEVSPGILEKDLNVNSIVQGGDVFCFGGIWTTDYVKSAMPLNNWPIPHQLDVQFYNRTEYKNPWGEEVSNDGNPIRKWHNSTWYMFKILNDSIKLGLKPANDPNDFELIEIFGMNGYRWIVGGVLADRVMNWMRKPEIHKGNPLAQSSFGTNPVDSEWIMTNPNYWRDLGYGWPWRALYVGYDLGQHYMYEPTHYKSTVSSIVYKVSEGYSMNESIKGLTTGTTVANFMGGVIKANESQTLKVKRGNTELAMSDVIDLNDVLEVISADSTNTTKYVLNVTDEGLSSNAVLTSSRYNITIEQQPKSSTEAGEAGVGSIKGFEYGTALRTVLANITVPYGANLSVIDGRGAYVPLKMLNFDTSYVNVTVKGDIYFDVLAENGVTKIVYQLQPNSSQNDAFILSDVYVVSQKENLVNYIPRGTTAQTLISNVSPSLGATVKVVDKMGYEREGTLYDDDKIVVTSVNGVVTRAYHLAMLRTEYILEPMYLAYILSNVYAVDQVLYKVSGVDGSEAVSSFLSKVTPAAGATAVIVDKDGIIKTTGDVVGGDMVQVTSVDGKIKVFYTFGPLTSASTIQSTNIELYPNPTSGVINVSGVKTGYRIQVYNSIGAVIRDIKTKNNLETLSLENQPAGMYLIVVSDNKQMLGRYKVMKQ